MKERATRERIRLRRDFNNKLGDRKMDRKTIERLLNNRSNAEREKYASRVDDSDKLRASIAIDVINLILRDIDFNSNCLCRVCGEDSGVIGKDSVCGQCTADERDEFQEHDDSYGSRPGERGYND